MKNNEELNAIKEEVETVNRKLHELKDEDLEQISGGSGDKGKRAPINGKCPFCGAHIMPAGSDPRGEVRFWNCPNCGQIRVYSTSGYWLK